MASAIHRIAAPVKRLTPRWFWVPARRVLIGILGPALFSWKEGHFLSSLKDRAVARDGSPLPWYTYPAIDFLSGRDFRGKRILELGTGQSTHWWAARAREVVGLEEDRAWMQRVAARAAPNVELHFIRMDSATVCVSDVERTLAGKGTFDIVVIDGLFRRECIDEAVRVLNPGGAIVCDNSEGWDFYGAFRDRGFMRMDFFGMAPAGIHSDYCTSIFFKPDSFLVDPKVPIARGTS